MRNNFRLSCVGIVLDGICTRVPIVTKCPSASTTAGIAIYFATRFSQCWKQSSLKRKQHSGARKKRPAKNSGLGSFARQRFALQNSYLPPAGTAADYVEFGTPGGQKHSANLYIPESKASQHRS